MDGDLGATINSINSKHLKRYKFFVPKPKEQQKIAHCLSSVDELITAEGQKLEALQDHKIGLMQQLFPAEGERLPKLRFPEFCDKWKIKRIGQLGQFIGGGTPSKSVAEYWDGQIPWISSSDILEDDIHSISMSRFINDKGLADSATKLVPKGSVLFVSRVGTGKLAINEMEVCTSQDFTNFMPETIHNYFVGYYFLAKKAVLESLGQGTSIKGFSKKDLENCEICVPSKEEQLKISKVLSNLDSLIASQSLRIRTLQDHKKSLMQQLFPSAEEVMA